MKDTRGKLSNLKYLHNPKSQRGVLKTKIWTENQVFKLLNIGMDWQKPLVELE
jgi:hypothetical protein